MIRRNIFCVYKKASARNANFVMHLSLYIYIKEMCNKGVYKNILIMKYLIDIYKVATFVSNSSCSF